jgi:hypothetical protein
MAIRKLQEPAQGGSVTAERCESADDPITLKGSLQALSASAPNAFGITRGT